MVGPNTDTRMSNAHGGWRNFSLEEMRKWWREVSRAYCERVVTRSLATAPLGGHDWFLEVERAAR